MPTLRAEEQQALWEAVTGGADGWDDVVASAERWALGTMWGRDDLLEAAPVLASAGLTVREVVSGLAVVSRYATHPRDVAVGFAPILSVLSGR